ncbi:hypothetical protein C0995_001816 [Termitomyces sp. Mi166|nr:hypothetical protein C0995_001816 [Termitomyces sp. Mi166\
MPDRTSKEDTGEVSNEFIEYMIQATKDNKIQQQKEETEHNDRKLQEVDKVLRGISEWEEYANKGAREFETWSPSPLPPPNLWIYQLDKASYFFEAITDAINHICLRCQADFLDTFMERESRVIYIIRLTPNKVELAEIEDVNKPNMDNKCVDEYEVYEDE